MTDKHKYPAEYFFKNSVTVMQNDLTQPSLDLIAGL